MSRPRGGYVGVTSLPGAAMPGVWTLREVQQQITAQQWPPFYDPFLSSVSLALNFEGSFSDQSANAYTITAQGGASISSSVSAVGTRSALFVSSSSQYASVSNGIVDGLTPLTFGTSDFCLETWVYPTSYTRSSETVSNVDFDYFVIGNGNGGLFLTNSHNARFGAAAFFCNQSTIVSLSGANNSVPINSWTHLAYSRATSTGRLFVNGQQVATVTDATNYSSPFTLIGGRGFSIDTRYFNGYLDGVRITKGNARYVSTFTPYRTLPTQ